MAFSPARSLRHHLGISKARSACWACHGAPEISNGVQGTYKGCTTVVQRLYKGCTRDQQARNTGATPEQYRSNALAARLSLALCGRPALHQIFRCRVIVFRLTAHGSWVLG